MSEIKGSMKKGGIYSRKSFSEGTIFVHEGAFANEAYLIQSGRVRVFTKADGKDVDLAELGPGNIIGEIALIMDEPRTASVQALEDVNAVVVTRHDFETMMKKTDPTVQSVLRLLSQRLKANNTDEKIKAKASDEEKAELNEEAIEMTRNLAKNLNEERKLLFMELVLPQMAELVKVIRAFRHADE